MKAHRRMVRAVLSLMTLLASTSFSFAAAAAPVPSKAPPKEDRDAHRELPLVVGETTTLSAVGIKNYTEGAPGIVDVRLTPDGCKFVLVGRKPGATQLLLIRNDGSQATFDVVV